MPTPRPEISVTSSCVEKPGLENQLVDVGERQRVVGGDQPAADGFCENLCGVEARAVVFDLDDDVAGLVKRAQAQPRVHRLARRGAHVARLDAVVDGVADHVHQRIGDVLDDLAIELGVLTGQHEIDRLCPTSG